MTGPTAVRATRDGGDASPAFVIDASVAIKWVIEEAGSDHAAALLDGRPLLAPDLLMPECANILWKKATRGEVSNDEAAMAADLLGAVCVELVPMRGFLAAATRLALELGHPAYDCFYLALAVDRDVPMITADGRFVAALRRHGGYARWVRPLDGACVE